MPQLLQQQYTMVKSTRSIVFDFLLNEVRGDINTRVAAFADKTIDQMLQHVAFCYYNWLACFAMKRPVLNNHNLNTADLYLLVDEVVESFLHQYNGMIEVPITGVHDTMGQLSATPLELFTHVTTHEFHHKGQIMSVCRILGHLPPDTDTSNFFDSK